VNHRIFELSSVTELKKRWSKVLTPIAKRFDVSLEAFADSQYHKDGSHGLLNLTDAYGTGLEPAPVTPTFGSPAWELLSGTIRASLSSSRREIAKSLPVYVAPSSSLGNTDTRHYWNLTKNIFRYGHLSSRDSNNGAHTINEAVRGEGFLEVIRFHSRLILNMDETSSL